MHFLISALRAVIELIGLCLLGQGILYLIAGAGSGRNLIYRFFALVTAPPRRLAQALAPASVPDRMIPGLTFLFLVFLWIGLAWIRKFI